MKLRTLLAITASASMLAVTGCTEAESTPVPALDTDGIVIVTASHANVPVPQLSPANVELLASALTQGIPVTVVSADGTPAVVKVGLPTVSADDNEAYRARQVSKALDTLAAAVTVLPDSPGASAYEALGVAEHEARGYSNPTIVCPACGLDSTGPLDLTADGMIYAEPEDIVEHLASSGSLISFEDYTSFTVILTSVGATAAPQEQLSYADQEGLAAIWAAVLAAGGASVEVDPNSLTGESVDTEFEVPTVSLVKPEPIEPPVSCEPQSISFDGASAARFQSNLAEWVDESAAREALRPLAEWLAEDRSRTATVDGTTAVVDDTNPKEGRELSLRRAQAAADLLIDLGADPAQIASVKGLGWNYDGRVEDRTSSGDPIPAKRILNRKVLITLTNPC